jgi:cytochrome b involved in lipid metabolism
MCNFRERALKHYLEEKPIDLNSAEKILKFQPLVTSERPVLSSLPKETKWLVIHGVSHDIHLSRRNSDWN